MTLLLLISALLSVLGGGGLSASAAPEARAPFARQAAAAIATAQAVASAPRRPIVALPRPVAQRAARIASAPAPRPIEPAYARRRRE